MDVQTHKTFYSRIVYCFLQCKKFIHFEEREPFRILLPSQLFTISLMSVIKIKASLYFQLTPFKVSINIQLNLANYINSIIY